MRPKLKKLEPFFSFLSIVSCHDSAEFLCGNEKKINRLLRANDKSFQRKIQDKKDDQISYWNHYFI
jgi:hypothetical protein